MLKIGFCLLLTYILYMTYPPAASLEYGNNAIVYGFVHQGTGVRPDYRVRDHRVFGLVFTSGQIIDMHMGLGMAGVTDVQNEAQVPMVGNLLNLILISRFSGSPGTTCLSAS